MKANVEIIFFQTAAFDTRNRVTVRLRRTVWEQRVEYVLEAEVYAGVDPSWNDPTISTKEILPDYVESGQATGTPAHREKFRMRDEYAIRLAITEFDRLYSDLAAAFTGWDHED